MAACGAPSWYITLSPADIQHPIGLYFAGDSETFQPKFMEYGDCLHLMCNNSVAGA